MNACGGWGILKVKATRSDALLVYIRYHFESSMVCVCVPLLTWPRREHVCCLEAGISCAVVTSESDQHVSLGTCESARWRAVSSVQSGDQHGIN